MRNTISQNTYSKECYIEVEDDMKHSTSNNVSNVYMAWELSLEFYREEKENLLMNLTVQLCLHFNQEDFIEDNLGIRSSK